ncbi:MAG: hypothetical protein P1U84_04985 [Parvibaculaceae bacterium]|nr:hypothetical protein [Parvibaculaceae bacterium]
MTTLTDIEAEFRMDRPRAIAVWAGKEDEDGKEVWAWLPKNLVEDNGDGTYTMPEWLAHEKGLI